MSIKETKMEILDNGMLFCPQMSLKTKQRMLKEDWEFFKQKKFIEEQVGH